MYLSDSVEMKKSQLEGKDNMLENIYYYNPSIKSIQKYSNILRSDLGLSKITDKDDFLNERVIDHYGSLVPLTKLDDSLLRKAQNDTTNKKHKKITVMMRINNQIVVMINPKATIWMDNNQI